MKQIWSCKIGVTNYKGFNCRAPDHPMRQAIEKAFKEVVGIESDFNFSGWNAELTEPELAVVENRPPEFSIDWEYRAKVAEAELAKLRGE